MLAHAHKKGLREAAGTWVWGQVTGARAVPASGLTCVAQCWHFGKKSTLVGQAILERGKALSPPC